MKYYIDDKLVRTSKTHTYTHAVLFGDKVKSCSGSYELAKKEMDRRIAELDESIRNSKLAIAAIEEGKNYYWTTFKRRSYKAEITSTREEYLGYIAANEELKTRYHIRELEAR